MKKCVFHLCLFQRTISMHKAVRVFGINNDFSPHPEIKMRELPYSNIPEKGLLKGFTSHIF